MRFTMRSTPTKLACLLLLAAVAGCQAGGIGADDASGQPRVATEQPFSAATRRPAGATARKDVAGTGAPGRRVAAAEGASSEAGVEPRPQSAPALRPGPGPHRGSDPTLPPPGRPKSRGPVSARRAGPVRPRDWRQLPPLIRSRSRHPLLRARPLASDRPPARGPPSRSPRGDRTSGSGSSRFS